LYEKNIKEVNDREEAMRRIYEATNKFVPYEFIQSLGHSVITDVRLGDQVEKIVTVLFSDIRNYTTISEKMTPEENFSFICSFNEQIGPIIMGLSINIWVMRSWPFSRAMRVMHWRQQLRCSWKCKNLTANSNRRTSQPFK
jgi:hypothetical protein